MNRLETLMDELFGINKLNSEPIGPGEFYLKLPGYGREDVEAFVENDFIVIKSDEDREEHLPEFGFSFALNPTVDRDSIEIDLDKGLMRIRLGEDQYKQKVYLDIN